MKIDQVIISSSKKYKVKRKHGIDACEIEQALLNRPLIFKTKYENYLAIGKAERYITVVFKYLNKCAEIVTAYSSSEWQINLYKKKRG